MISFVATNCIINDKYHFFCFKLQKASCNAMLCCIRYGQDEIQEMLIARGAKESVQVPKVTDNEMPSWVRKSSRVEN